MDIQALLAQAVARQASDLFITVGSPPALKIDGALTPLTDQPPLSSEAVNALVAATLNDTQQTALAQTREANFAIVLDDGTRFRVSAFYQRGEPGLVIRRIETQIPTLEELALPGILGELAGRKRGLILFVGGTGTGKSTSLAAMIGARNTHHPGHILTIEDPVEFIHPHRRSIVTQREVGVDTDSFETALKNALRQAPDVVLIGEVRSREVMDYAVAFAETGHLTLATLHANNANQALDRIINFFPSDRREQLLMDLSLNLQAIVAQQLIPAADGRGRVAALEVLLNTPLIQERIRNGAIHELKATMAQSEEPGMQTFDHHLFELYSAGRIRYEDALAHADSANEVRLRVKLEGEDPTGPESDDGPGLRLRD
ncbi:PilT/PilU family type 4a pilus ATPase [Halorhodospira halophila]|uniref:Twitching motility protein n=1 Tax=Halorhodospira halophila (strain DSM 244 / SL1) TaxID=349124 RepID=A1WTU5_HALHL|nr:PilT/PilU family type 4a pilus ATPase [Halorhodospira halophila]ABM61107.1 twitching motility protein [Halorhodospira halophila SL1]MBK1729824.1 type IV pili twitching motility protein PilT [Halorhodospira halophila]